MIKKYIFRLLLFFSVVTSLVNASASSTARIENNFYDNLEEAIATMIL